MNPKSDYFIDRLNFNKKLIIKSFEDMHEQEIQKAFNDSINSAIYILGHITMSRHYLSNLISKEKSELRFMDYFGYKNSFNKLKKYPSYERLNVYFIEVSELLIKTIQTIEDYSLDMDTKIPSYSRNVEDVISFLIDHELYHIGQLNLIRKLYNYEAVPFK